MMQFLFLLQSYFLLNTCFVPAPYLVRTIIIIKYYYYSRNLFKATSFANLFLKPFVSG